MAGNRGGHHRRPFVPKNPDKYRGNKRNIVARSSWERMMMVWLDRNPAVLAWASEEVVVPYVSPVDGQQHRYFVDFYVKFVDKNGEVKEKLVEIKPEGQTRPPKNRNAKNFKDQVETYAINCAKWEAATRYAMGRKMEFQVLTEHDLGLTRKPDNGHA